MPDLKVTDFCSHRTETDCKKHYQIDEIGKLCNGTRVGNCGDYKTKEDCTDKQYYQKANESLTGWGQCIWDKDKGASSKACIIRRPDPVSFLNLRFGEHL